MNDGVLPLGLAAILASGNPVTAAIARVDGTIQSIDIASRTIMLSDGHVYLADRGVDLAPLRAGRQVKVSFTAAHNQRLASRIVPVS